MDVKDPDKHGTGTAGKKCELCDVTYHSPAVEKSHLAGKKHMRKLQGATDKKCELCDVTYHNPAVEKSHLRGKKHMRKLQVQEQKETQTPKINKNRNSSSEQKQPGSILKGYCDVCNIAYIGAARKKEHFSGRKHNSNKYKEYKKNGIAKMEQKQQHILGKALLDTNTFYELHKNADLLDTCSTEPPDRGIKQRAGLLPMEGHDSRSVDDSSLTETQSDTGATGNKCELCDVTYHNSAVAKSHLAGKRHMRKLQVQEEKETQTPKINKNGNSSSEPNQQSSEPNRQDEIKSEPFDFGAIRHYNENRLSPDDKVTRIRIVHYLETLIQKRIPNSYLLVYGSTLSGLDKKSSDIDLGLVCYDYDSYEELFKSRTEIKQVLQRSRNHIRKHLGDLSCFSILRARVPILKLRILGIDCDIAYLNSYANIDKAELLESYRKIDDRVAPFLFALRTWKNNRGIGDAGSGTFNTFSTNLLGLQYLQISIPPVLPCLQNNPDDLYDFGDHKNYVNFGEKNKKSIQELLEEFFDVYTDDFDYEYQIVSVRSGCFIPKGKFREEDRSVFGIEDPFEIDENVARNVSENSVKLIINEFERAAVVMQDTDVTFEKLVTPQKTVKKSKTVKKASKTKPQQQQRKQYLKKIVVNEELGGSSPT